MEAGKLQAGPLATHEFGIGQIQDAFDAADDKSASGAIRVMVIP